MGYGGGECGYGCTDELYHGAVANYCCLCYRSGGRFGCNQCFGEFGTNVFTYGTNFGDECDSLGDGCCNLSDDCCNLGESSCKCSCYVDAKSCPPRPASEFQSR